MGAKSRRKGAKGELIIARKLSAWWMNDPELEKEKAANLPIRRTPLSGGWASGSNLSGDLVAVQECAATFGIFSVEVKNQERWAFEGMFTNDKWIVNTWWAQCKKAAKKEKAIPWLVFTRNNQPWYFRMKYIHFKRLSGERVPKNFMTHGGCVYGLLDDFLSTYSKEKCLDAFHAMVTFNVR